jgi:hypothetical protein
LQNHLKSTSEPFNAGSVIPGDGLYDDGSKLTLNAVPNFPYHPNKWIGVDTDTNPASVTMNSDKSITIVFELNSENGTKTQDKAVSKDALGRWGDVFSESIQLNQFDWVEGELVWQTPNTPSTPIQSYIQDPAGNIIKNFNSNMQANFQFFAPNAGQYAIVFKNSSIWYADFHLTYTIWEK